MVTTTGPAITHESCGTHIPIVDPGSQFQTIEDVFDNNVFWGSYDISITTLKTPWFDLQSGQPDCGLTYTLTFRIEAIAPIAGKASGTPANDTGDPLIIDEGVGSILVANGVPWGSNT
jgi:hypothetical protein